MTKSAKCDHQHQQNTSTIGEIMKCADDKVDHFDNSDGDTIWFATLMMVGHHCSGSQRQYNWWYCRVSHNWYSHKSSLCHLSDYIVNPIKKWQNLLTGGHRIFMGAPVEWETLHDSNADRLPTHGGWKVPPRPTNRRGDGHCHTWWFRLSWSSLTICSIWW